MALRSALVTFVFFLVAAIALGAIFHYVPAATMCPLHKRRVRPSQCRGQGDAAIISWRWDRAGESLKLTTTPVAITFLDAAPPGVPRVAAIEPASCGYWRRAAAGEVFFTTADDHKRCPVGAHTHHVTLSPAEQQELMGLVQTMVGLSYLKAEEVPSIPTRRTPLQVAVYVPLADATAAARCGPSGRRAPPPAASPSAEARLPKLDPHPRYARPLVERFVSGELVPLVTRRRRPT